MNNRHERKDIIIMKYKRVDKETPNGGAYSEIYYLDDNFRPADSSTATMCMIHECDENGGLICETIGRTKNAQGGKKSDNRSK